MEPVVVKCCIAGGGPAGVMLGVLLARAGVETLVLEKHKDFLRDFRGDTVHPSTLDVVAELGVLDQFLARPHQQLREIRGQIGNTPISVADFTHTHTRCQFIALMPQWDFLNFLSEFGARYPAFHLTMEAEVTELRENQGRVVGVIANTSKGRLEIAADLVIGADGRQSTVRERAKLEVEDLGSPIDVLWMRVSKKDSDPSQTLGYFNSGRVLVTLDRGDYWQCAFVIPKGGFDKTRAAGLEAFRSDIAAIAPFLRDRLEELDDWQDIKLLTVSVDRLRRWWRPGLLCIGDAAHAMSPIGGVGINLAIQDAVAAANILARPLLDGALTDRHLEALQRRRMFPTRVTQRIQVLAQNRVISRVLATGKPLTLPWPLRLLNGWPWLRRIPARVVGVGIRPEHVRTPDSQYPA